MTFNEFVKNVEVDETDVPQLLITSSATNGVKLHSTLNVDNQKRLLIAICEQMGLFNQVEEEFNEEEIIDDFDTSIKQTDDGYSVIGEGTDMDLLRTDKILTGAIIDPMKMV